MILTNGLNKDELIKFTKWLKHIDNGTIHYDPFFKKASESIGFSPYDCFVEGTLSEEELVEEYLKIQNEK